MAAKKRPKRRKQQRHNVERARQADDCVSELLDLISAGAHMGRPTLKRKAEEWGMTLDAAQRHEAAAYRILRLRYRNDTQMRTAIYARIEGLVNAAMGRTRTERRKNKASPSGYDLLQLPDPDIQTALKGLEMLGKELGMFDPAFRNDYNRAVGELIQQTEKTLGVEAANKLLMAFAAGGSDEDDLGPAKPAELPELSAVKH